jgi:flagellar motor switch protein FliG
MATTAGEMSGLRKAAVLLLKLGKEESAKLLAQLPEDEVEELSTEIARLGLVDPDVGDEILTEFHALTKIHQQGNAGGVEVAREMLIASLGEERAREIMDRLSAVVTDVPFSFLGKADPRQVVSFLQHEHPQTIALVLAHVPASLASAVLSALGSEAGANVAHRIAVMDRTSPEIIRQVEEALARKFSTVLQPSEMSVVGGVEPLVEIINRADRATERLILEGLEQRSPEIAEEIRRKLFMFEDIVHLDDRSIQLVLRQIDTNDLALALKGVSDNVRTKVTGNLSERARENLAEEIDLLGPVRLRMVEEAQAKIVQAIRALEDSGQIEIQRGGEDDEFVS